ncbi:MAG: DUF3224 domain-containing protein [Planctomycetes bacterium]|nr:DUF3224 domain-containing protein [Planctomycetota bacterium]
MPTANATFKVASWKEEPYTNEPQKMVQAKVERTFEGDLVGESHTEYLMAYTPTGASFVGLERFTGSLSGKTGSFVFQRDGTAGSDGVVREQFMIVVGSGTGELKGITGRGNWESAHAESYTISFEYEL